jgi:lipid A 3-O-deacylase
MKKVITTLLCLLSLSVSAEDERLSFAVDIGGSDGDINIYRLGIQKEFTDWLHSHDIPLSGYFEGSLNYWESSNSEIYAIAFSPVFVIPLCDSCNYTPYIEAGTGISFISEKVISNKDLSSSFQFENRVGVGIKTKNIDYHIRYMHYSNASTSSPNDGIDIFLAGMAFKF